MSDSTHWAMGGAEIPRSDRVAQMSNRIWVMIHSFVGRLVPIKHVEHKLFKDIESPHKLWTILDKILQDVDEELKRRLSQIQQIVVIEDEPSDAKL
jgi:hypothetical protein